MKTGYGYKLFEQNADGNLFPLFIDKKAALPMDEWLHAEYHPTKGFAPRGGWHIGADVPDAPWLKGYDGTDTGCYRSRWKTGRRVWCEVEYNATVDYNLCVQKMPKKCFDGGVPENGFYFFREAGKGTWVITSDIRIARIITEDDRRKIMRDRGYNEVEAFAKYKAIFEKRMKSA